MAIYDRNVSSRRTAFANAYQRALNYRNNYSNNLSNHIQNVMDEEDEDAERRKAEGYYEFEVPQRHSHHHR